jgi:hypothetical protein
MAREHIEFRGVRVLADWPEQLRQAQLFTTVRPNGIEMPRVRYGDEADDWGADHGPCHDCAAIKGEFHGPGCDVERCPSCGGQIYGCDCDWPDVADDA